MRLVRLTLSIYTRVAEPIDKAYRLGVFHLESLRLRRDKLQTSAARVSAKQVRGSLRY